MKHAHTTIRKTAESGSAMIIAVIFFVVISALMVLGLTGPSVREYRTATDSLSAHQSYFLAESGVEDAYYRLKNNKQWGTGAGTLVLGTTSTTTTIAPLDGEQVVTSLGIDDSHERQVSLTVSGSAGVPHFTTGILGGVGGFNMVGTSSVTGDVYSAGSVTGDGSTSISGAATSGTSPALAIDAVNSGVSPTDTIVGDTISDQALVQSFQPLTLSPLSALGLYVKKVGNPSDATVTIVADSSGVPGTSVIARGTLSAASVGGSYGWVNAAFSTSPMLSVGSTYWFIVSTTPSNTDYYIFGAQNGYSGTGLIGNPPSNWRALTPSTLSYFFQLYLGGFTGLIQTNSGSALNRFSIGGDARAHTINYSSVGGTMYCQSGTLNTKPCTTATDPAMQAFPISPTIIAGWENDAVAGGIISGDWNVTSSHANTPGPREITGSLTLSGGDHFIVGGTLWIRGNLVINAPSTITLSSSYGANSGIIIVDGTVSSSTNAANFLKGSGTVGSYLLLADTDASVSAVTLGGGAATSAMIYAPYGTVNLSSTGIQQASGYRVVLTNSNIQYNSTIATTTFSSGSTAAPSYSIAGWRETAP